MVADKVVVLHHQDRPDASVDNAYVRIGALVSWFRRGSGKVEAECRPFTRFGLHVDMAVRLADEAVDHAQPETGALSDFLCGKKRLEDPLRDLRRHAGTGILD